MLSCKDTWLVIKTDFRCENLINSNRLNFLIGNTMGMLDLKASPGQEVCFSFLCCTLCLRLFLRTSRMCIHFLLLL